jgi:hypothetical protein
VTLLRTNSSPPLNDTGAIAGSAWYSDPANPQAQGENHAFLLLPLEIRDVGSMDLDADDVLIEPIPGEFSTSDDSYWKGATERNIASITAHRNDGTAQADDPRMPQLQVRFVGCPSGLKVKFTFKCSYQRGNGYRKPATRPEDTITISIEDPTGIPAAQPWKLYTTPEWNGDFFGGNCELSYRITTAEGIALMPEGKACFVIGGSNPERAKAKDFIDAAVAKGYPALWYAYAIAKEESRDYAGPEYPFYNQFFTRYRPANARAQRTSDWRAWRLGFPTFNDDPAGPGGYGIFQNTREKIPRKEIWNWQQNVNAGLREIAEKNAVATRYYTRIQGKSALHRTAFEECPPPSISVRDHVFSSSDAITIHAYNGTGNATIDARYRFDPTKPCGLGVTQRWFWNPYYKYQDAPHFYLDRVERELE